MFRDFGRFAWAWPSLAAVVLSCDPPPAPLARVPEPPLRVAPERLNLGEVQVGLGATAAVTVTNPSRLDLVLEVVRLESASSAAFKLELAPAVLSARGEVQVQVRFSPTTEGAHQAQLRMIHSGMQAQLPPIELTGRGVAAQAPPPTDQDRDGTPVPADCDDLNPRVYPGAIEVCDGLDNNCAGGIDEGLQTQLFFRDQDADGYGHSDTSTVSCAPPVGFVPLAGDCDDNAMNRYPGAIEVCGSGVDEDCDGLVDAEDPDCNTPCATQDQCGLNGAKLACPLINQTSPSCAPLCRGAQECASMTGCRPLAGSSGLGSCARSGAVAIGGACAQTSDCGSGLCVWGQCRALCQTQADCSGTDVCGPTLYEPTELGGAGSRRQTTICQPLMARRPFGQSCLAAADEADTGLCASTHCDFLPWAAQLTAAPPACAPLCAGSSDCGAGQVCGLVFHGPAESPPILSSGEGAGRYFEGVLGCYSPVFFDGNAWTALPPGSAGLGSPCDAARPEGRFACRSHQCATFAPIANRCTDFCDDDSDCVSPATPDWRCQVGELALSSVFLQSAGVSDPTKFTLVGVCAP